MPNGRTNGWELGTITGNTYSATKDLPLGTTPLCGLPRKIDELAPASAQDTSHSQPADHGTSRYSLTAFPEATAVLVGSGSDSMSVRRLDKPSSPLPRLMPVRS